MPHTPTPFGAPATARSPDAQPGTPVYVRPHPTLLIDLGLTLLTMGAQTPDQMAEVRSERISIAKGRIMLALAQSEAEFPEGMKLKDLVARTRLSASTASEAVEQLVHLGFVTRERSPSDRRSIAIRMGAAGRAAMTDQRLADVWDEATAGLPAEDVAAFWRVAAHAAATLARRTAAATDAPAPKAPANAHAPTENN